MRLTLRTLLSYLDDTLDPKEARSIGEKVSESDIAPDLIERIKKVTRRRGLAAPAVMPDGDDSAADPNVAAEYLDNTLPADQVAELEQAALDSDATLAEVASCHQILTLVLGEPAKVPPTARQHMYRIVKGRESVHYRRLLPAGNVAGVAGLPDTADEAEADDALLLGLQGKRLFIPIVTAGIITLLLLLMIWLAIPTPGPTAREGYIAVAGPVLESRPNVPVVEKIKPAAKGDEDNKPREAAGPAAKAAATRPANTGEPPKAKVEVGPPPKVVEDAPKAKVEPVKEPARQVQTPPDKPDPQRRAVGRLNSTDFLLLQRQRDNDDWVRAVPQADLFSTDTLLSLPGQRNLVRLESGVGLLIYGTMPEYHGIDLSVWESRVRLHIPPPGIAADLTLEAGRVYITPPAAAKGEKFEPSRVRVRCKSEIWDITLLDPDSEVSFDLIGYYRDDAPFSLEPGGKPPTIEVTMGVLSGRAGLKFGFHEYPLLTAPTRVEWNSDSPDRIEPIRVTDRELDLWHKWSDKKVDNTNEFAKRLQAAAAHYAKRFNAAKPDETRIDIAFHSAVEDHTEDPARRVFALRSLQALDEPEYFASALSDDEPFMRPVAVRCVQHWAGLAPTRDLALYKLLVNKQSFTEAQAQAVLQLLHPLPAADYDKPEIIAALFEAMKNEKVAVRELAYKHLVYGDPVGAREIGPYDAAAVAELRDPLIEKWKASWKKRFVDKK